MLYHSLFTKRNIQKVTSLKKLLLLLALSGMGLATNAQDNTVVRDSIAVDSATASGSKIFQLGEVLVVSKNEKPINATVDAEKMENFYKTDVARALNILPGINLSSTGSLGEPTSMVYVRGFNLRQVPLLIDGIPVYVPNDGSDPGDSCQALMFFLILPILGTVLRFLSIIRLRRKVYILEDCCFMNPNFLPVIRSLVAAVISSDWLLLMEKRLAWVLTAVSQAAIPCR